MLIAETEARKLFVSEDSIDTQNYIIADYRIIPADGHPITQVAAGLALLTSVGTVQPMPYETEAGRRQSTALVISVSDPGQDRASIVRIAYPLILFGKKDGIAQLINVLTFAAEYKYSKQFRVEGFTLPKTYLRRYKGPKHGLSGLRTILGVHGRPILGGIIKPRAGASLATVEEKAKQALQGGVDFIVDDELILDPDGEFAFDKRVACLANVAERASTPQDKKSYIASVTSNPRRAHQLARKALSLGAKGVLVNAFSIGFPALHDLSSDAQLKGLLFACNLGSSVFTRNRDASGIAGGVIAKLCRIAGADAIHTGISSAAWYGNEAWSPSIVALRNELQHVKVSIPVAAGGMSIANLWQNLRDLGTEAIFEAGSGIFGTDAGPQRTAVAMRKVMSALQPEMDDASANTAIVNLARKDGDILKGLRQFGYQLSGSV